MGVGRHDLEYYMAGGKKCQGGVKVLSL